MGNCCGGGESSDEHRNLTQGRNNQAFQGTGHRLGTADEVTYQNNNVGGNKTSPMNRGDADDAPKPVYDKNLTDEEREKIRADRAAAAEQRLKKQGGKQPKKKKTNPDAPLVGPNSQPAMRWTAG